MSNPYMGRIKITEADKRYPTASAPAELIERAKAFVAKAVGCPVQSASEIDLSDKDQVFTEDAVAAVVAALTAQPSAELIERVAHGIRRGRFERTGRAEAYDPTLPLLETDLADARAALAAMSEGVDRYE